MLRRLVRRRFGAAAPRVAVRTHVPWYIRYGLPIVLTVAGLAGAAVVVGPYGVRPGDATTELAGLRARIDALEGELAQHRSVSQSAGSTLQIERTTREQIERQLKTLEAENVRLKQDLSLFESLAEVEGSASDATISGLAVEPEGSDGKYRYRMLIAVRGAGKSEREREFRGQLQLIVKMRHQGKAAMMNLPSAGDPKRDQFRLNFKHFQRVDGSFEVPHGAQVLSVEVRLIEDGATKVAKVFNLG